MAIMQLSSKMVYWKIELDGQDFTSILNPVVNSIQVRYSILPMPKMAKKPPKEVAYSKRGMRDQRAPSEADIVITSRNYIEDLFTVGREIKIYMGYDKIYLPLVFHGYMAHLPDGSIREALNYTVKAFSKEILLAGEQKNRTFVSNIRTNIITEVMAYYDYVYIIQIDDYSPLPGKYQPIQRAQTDLEFLTQCAANWKCTFWFEHPNIFYFVDNDKVHEFKTPFVMGYRTDLAACNVETVSWKHEPSRVADATNPGIGGFNELGKTKSLTEFKINAIDLPTGRWATFMLEDKWAKFITSPKIDKAAQAHIAAQIRIALARGWLSEDNYNAFRFFYKLQTYNDNVSPDSPPSYADSGFSFSIRLNTGELSLTPPRAGLLYSGTLNPGVDTAYMPAWMNSPGLGKYYVMKLKINEVYLNYDSGKLYNDLRCTMGMFV